MSIFHFLSPEQARRELGVAPPKASTKSGPPLVLTDAKTELTPPRHGSGMVLRAEERVILTEPAPDGGFHLLLPDGDGRVRHLSGRAEVDQAIARFHREHPRHVERQLPPPGEEPEVNFTMRPNIPWRSPV